MPRAHRPVARRRRRAAALTTFAALAVAAAAVMSVPAGASPAPAAPDATQASGPLHSLIRYAVDRPMCSQPANPHLMRCFALRRVAATAETPGAYRYRQSAGVHHGPAGGYTPADLASAYGYNPRIDRSHLTVGVVLWHDDPAALHDLNAFDRHYGFRHETARSFRKVNQSGRTAPLAAPDRNAAGEISLDLETLRSVCRSCRLLLVEASQPTAPDLATAENTAVRMGAQVVNNSFGAIEYRLPARIRGAFNHPGHVIVASTGDDGWYGWDWANQIGGTSDGTPSFPASSPDVVSVGGTTLMLGGRGHRVSESVWNNNGQDDATGRNRHNALGASGGGCSRLYAAKLWQLRTPGYASAGCNGKRVAADVALDGDPQTGFDVLDSYGSGGWVTVGGTSLSAPLASGMFALAGGSRGVRYPSSQLYLNSQFYPHRRFDITSGGNSYCGGDGTNDCAAAVNNLSLGLGTHNPNNLNHGLVDCSFPRHGADATSPPLSRECNAVTGFDGPSGVGAPNGLRLFRPTAPSVSVRGPARKHARNPGTFRVRVHETLPKTHVTRLVWSWGDGHRRTTMSRRLQHAYRRPGTYQITVTVRDNRFQVASATHTVVVRKP